VEAYESGVVPDVEFTADDMATLNRNWSWIFEVGAGAHGPGGLVSAGRFRGRPRAVLRGSRRGRRMEAGRRRRHARSACR
jgi:hypothetical protein